MLSIITLIAYILTKVSVTAYTGGIFLEFLLGLPFWYGAIGLIVLTGIFTVLSGMKGVMTLSAIQTPILIIGSFLVLSWDCQPWETVILLQDGQK